MSKSPGALKDDDRSESVLFGQESQRLNDATILAWKQLVEINVVSSSSSSSTTKQQASDVNNVDVGDLSPHLHPDCAIILITDDSDDTKTSKSKNYVTGRPHTIDLTTLFSNKTTTTTNNNTEDDDDVPDSATALTIIRSNILREGHHSAAYVHVKLPNSNNSAEGFFVFLKDSSGDDTGWIWKCISMAITTTSTASSSSTSPNTTKPTTGGDFSNVFQLGQGYCTANRQCDGQLMSNYFHSTCRLTYSMASTPTTTASSEYSIVICNSDQFYDKVQYRYEKETPHVPYQHLKDHPNVGDWDVTRSIEFTLVSSNLAIMILNVGHPPFLWTDILTCARLQENQEQEPQEQPPKWWIVHKSSENAVHPLVRTHDDED